jgi:hypothetical protein
LHRYPPELVLQIAFTQSEYIEPHPETCGGRGGLLERVLLLQNMFFARARSLVSRAVRNDGVHAVSYPAVCYGRDSIYLESESIKALQ